MLIIAYPFDGYFRKACMLISGEMEYDRSFRREDVFRTLPTEEAAELTCLFSLDGKRIETRDGSWELRLVSVWRPELPDDNNPNKKDRIVYDTELKNERGDVLELELWTFRSAARALALEDYFLDRIKQWLSDPEKESGEGLA